MPGSPLTVVAFEIRAGAVKHASAAAAGGGGGQRAPADDRPFEGPVLGMGVLSGRCVRVRA